MKKFLTGIAWIAIGAGISFVTFYAIFDGVDTVIRLLKS